MISIVIQIGTLNSKAGFGSESNPRISTESILVEANGNKNYHFEEEELFANSTHRQFTYNLDTSRRDVGLYDIFNKNWKDEEHRLGLLSCSIKEELYCKFLGELISEIKDNHQSEYGILLIEPAYLKKHEIASMRTSICEYLLDEHNLNAVYFLKNSVATNFAQGSTSGIVIDSGQNFTTISRVHDGYQDSQTNFNFGANLMNYEIERYLQKKDRLGSLTGREKQLEESNHLYELIRARQFRAIKDAMFQENGQIQSSRVVQVQLPDGQTITIDKDEIADPFSRLKEYKNQSQFLFPLNYRGIAYAIAELMQDSKEKVKNSLSEHITFTGGNFLYKDIVDRIESQIRQSSQMRNLGQVNCGFNKHKLLSNWIGGSIVASLPSFSPYWITNKDWKENGDSLVMKKCP